MSYFFIDRSFVTCSPPPSSDRVGFFVEQFSDAVLVRLKFNSLDPEVTLHMDHDVFRFLVKGKGRQGENSPGSLLLEKEDFSRFNMVQSK